MLLDTYDGEEREMMEIVRGVLLDKNENCWKMGFTVLTNCLV